MNLVNTFESTQFQDINHLKKYYRKLSLNIHPDKTRGSDEPFKKALEVYELGVTWFKTHMSPFCSTNPKHSRGIFDFFHGHGFEWSAPSYTRKLFKGNPIEPPPAFDTENYAKVWARCCLTALCALSGKITEACVRFVNAAATALNHLRRVYRRCITVGLSEDNIDFNADYQSILGYIRLFTPKYNAGEASWKYPENQFLIVITCQSEVPVVTLRFNTSSITTELVDRMFSKPTWAKEVSEENTEPKELAKVQKILDEIREEVLKAKEALSACLLDVHNESEHRKKAEKAVKKTMRTKKRL